MSDAKPFRGWAVFSGKVLLPFTLRMTRRESLIALGVNSRLRKDLDPLSYNCRRVVVTAETKHD